MVRSGICLEDYVTFIFLWWKNISINVIILFAVEQSIFFPTKKKQFFSDSAKNSLSVFLEGFSFFKTKIMSETPDPDERW